MNALIACTGVRIVRVQLPRFALMPGEFVAVHWPLPGQSPEEQILLSALRLATRVDGLVVEPPGLSVAILFDPLVPLHQPSMILPVGEELARRFGLDRQELATILGRHEIDPATAVGDLDLTTHRLLGIEGAWLASPGIFFDVAGLDPLGIRRVCARVDRKCRVGIGALMLAFPTISAAEPSSLFQADAKTVAARLVR